MSPHRSFVDHTIADHTITDHTIRKESPEMAAQSWSDEQEIEAQDEEWERAACRGGGGRLTPLFFSDDIADIAAAKAVCGSCALQSACLSGALERREPCGVWGGQLFANGAVLAFKRRRGRPPKGKPLVYAADPQCRAAG